MAFTTYIHVRSFWQLPAGRANSGLYRPSLAEHVQRIAFFGVLEVCQNMKTSTLWWCPNRCHSPTTMKWQGLNFVWAYLIMFLFTVCKLKIFYSHRQFLASFTSSFLIITQNKIHCQQNRHLPIFTLWSDTLNSTSKKISHPVFMRSYKLETFMSMLFFTGAKALSNNSALSNSIHPLSRLSMVLSSENCYEASWRLFKSIATQ